MARVKGDDAKRHSTATFAKKGEARVALNRELDRLALGARYRAPITLQELADRFLDQYWPPAADRQIRA